MAKNKVLIRRGYLNLQQICGKNILAKEPFRLKEKVIIKVWNWRRISLPPEQKDKREEWKDIRVKSYRGLGLFMKVMVKNSVFATYRWNVGSCEGNEARSVLLAFQTCATILKKASSRESSGAKVKAC